MAHVIDDIAQAVKEARERKGLSQRALSERSGVRQYQISKFENGTLDLRLSSLIQLARALDMEMLLVPRKSVPAVTLVMRGGEGAAKPAYTLDGDDDAERLRP